MKTKDEWREMRNALGHKIAQEQKKLDEMADRAELEGRDLTANEAEAWNRIQRKIDRFAEQREAAERQENSAPEEPPARSIFRGLTDHPPASTRSRPDRLAREERMTDWLLEKYEGRASYQMRGGMLAAGPEPFGREEVESFSIGRAIRAAATGDWEGAELEHRALSEGVGAAGGFLTPEVLSGPFIDLIRAKTRVLQAGATVVPLDSDQHSIPRIATGGTAAWRNENTAAFESDATFDRVTFTPRTLARTCLLSFELAEDMLPGAAAQIDDEIAGSLALELDRVALRGSGTPPEPRGVRNTAGVEVRADLGANGGTPANYDFLVKILAGVRRDNFDPNAVLYSARTEETLALLKATDNQPLQRPRMLDEVDELPTTQIPDNLTVGTSTDTSEAYAAQWNELLIGVRPSIGVRFVREEKADTLQYRITAFLRADIQLAHPAAFAVQPGIRP